MIRKTILGRNKLSSIRAHNMDLFLILRKARLFEANKHFLSDWLASEHLVKKKEKKKKRNRRGWASCSIGRKKNILAVYFCFLTLIWKIVFELSNWQSPSCDPWNPLWGTLCACTYFKRCVQYLLLPYLSVDVILCAISHGQEEL